MSYRGRPMMYDELYRSVALGLFLGHAPTGGILEALRGE